MSLISIRSSLAVAVQHSDIIVVVIVISRGSSQNAQRDFDIVHYHFGKDFFAGPRETRSDLLHMLQFSFDLRFLQIN